MSSRRKQISTGRAEPGAEGQSSRPTSRPASRPAGARANCHNWARGESRIIRSALGAPGARWLAGRPAPKQAINFNFRTPDSAGGAQQRAASGGDHYYSHYLMSPRARRRSLFTFGTGQTRCLSRASFPWTSALFALFLCPFHSPERSLAGWPPIGHRREAMKKRPRVMIEGKVNTVACRSSRAFQWRLQICIFNWLVSSSSLLTVWLAG